MHVIFPGCRKAFFLLVTLTIVPFQGVFFAQDSSAVVLFPDGLRFHPLRGNAQEAKLGLLYYTATSHLKVDIGNSIDIILFNDVFDDGDGLSAGVEFMAYAYATSYKGYRLQIDAIDGFFGGNLLYTAGESVYRFRFIHNSAHLVDGAFDGTELKWINNKLPIPYTRDFAELIYVGKLRAFGGETMYYGGMSYTVHRRPLELRRSSFILGAEYHHPELLGTFLGNPANFFFILNNNINGAPKYTLSTNIQSGVKFGDWQGKGMLFYVSYYTGNDVFSEYYANRVQRFGIGFSVDFPG